MSRVPEEPSKGRGARTWPAREDRLEIGNESDKGQLERGYTSRSERIRTVHVSKLLQLLVVDDTPPQLEIVDLLDLFNPLLQSHHLLHRLGSGCLILLRSFFGGGEDDRLSELRMHSAKERASRSVNASGGREGRTGDALKDPPRPLLSPLLALDKGSVGVEKRFGRADRLGVERLNVEHQLRTTRGRHASDRRSTRTDGDDSSQQRSTRSLERPAKKKSKKRPSCQLLRGDALEVREAKTGTTHRANFSAASSDTRTTMLCSLSLTRAQKGLS